MANNEYGTQPHLVILTGHYSVPRVAPSLPQLYPPTLSHDNTQTGDIGLEYYVCTLPFLDIDKQGMTCENILRK